MSSKQIKRGQKWSEKRYRRRVAVVVKGGPRPVMRVESAEFTGRSRWSPVRREFAIAPDTLRKGWELVDEENEPHAIPEFTKIGAFVSRVIEPPSEAGRGS